MFFRSIWEEHCFISCLEEQIPNKTLITVDKQEREDSTIQELAGIKSKLNSTKISSDFNHIKDEQLGGAIVVGYEDPSSVSGDVNLHQDLLRRTLEMELMTS